MADPAAGAAASPSSRSVLLPWIMWGLGALFFCYAFFQRVAPSVMVEELMRDFAVGAAVTGALSSLYFYPYAALQIPSGLLVDRFGPRRVLTVAALVAGLGSLAFGLADAIGLAYAGRALVGMGAAVSWVAVLGLAAAWFPPHRFALLSGLSMAAGVAGGVGGQVPASLLVEAVGWRGTLIIAAVLALGLSAAVWTIVRDRPASAAETPHPATGHGLLERLRMVVACRQAWVITLFAATIVAPMLSFAGLWGVPYMMRVYDMTRAEAAVTTSLILVGWGVGSPLFGWLTDAVGRRRWPMVLAAAGALATTLAWLYTVPPPALLYPLTIATGVFTGGVVIGFATARENVPGAAAGSVIGLVNSGVMVSAAVFQPLIGVLLDRAWNGETVNGVRVYAPEAFQEAMIVLPLCQGAALIATLLVRETFCRPRGKPPRSHKD